MANRWARVLRAVRRSNHRERPDAGSRLAALRSLGVDQSTYDGFAALSITARAALVASAVERFETIDVETIIGADAPRTRRLIERARAGYLAVAAKPPSGQEGVPPAGPDGPLAARVRSAASWAMTGAGPSR